ncbi:hypothetical protein [Kitasatospora indigofera]|uniref:hypothetical protein n=1 Tax=Kitasatospora indigofera TaxID=67307 RepID=UPI003678CD19
MGYELRRQLREVLGPQVTGLQRAVALEIADDANERTRKSAAKLDDLARWTGAKDADVVRNALKRLAGAGWEFRIPIGKGKDGRPLFAVPGVRMTFLVPSFKGVATAPPSGDEGGAPALPRGSHGSPFESEGVATALPSVGANSDGEPAAQGAVHGPDGVEEGVATAPPWSTEGGAPAPPSSKEQTSNTYKDSSPGAGRATATPSKKVDHHLETFGAFWLVYPKKRAREEAKKAWCQAIERGADPQKIVDAATGYARERAGEDPKFTKYPATWLNKGCYDDEPDTAPGQRPPLRAVAGGWQPYTNLTDDSAYHNGWS